MDAARKAMQMQAQVRQNAEEFKNTLNDLYSWEKEIKDKEREMQKSAAEERNTAKAPVRSQVVNKDEGQQEKNLAQDMTNTEAQLAATNSKQTAANSGDTTDFPQIGNGLVNYKLANDVKDKGNQKVKLGKFEEAIADYTEAIRIMPNNAIFYSNRALCYLKTERYELAIDDCDKAIDIDNLATKAYYRRMQANESLGNNMEALKDCTTVLIIDAKNAEAKRSLQRINDRLRKNAQSANGPNFSQLRNDTVDILPIDKPAYKRSAVPLHRVAIADVVGPKDSKNIENSNIKISDEDIDKLFNSNCGSIVEVKKSSMSSVKPKQTDKPAASKQSTDSIADKQQKPKIAENQAAEKQENEANISAAAAAKPIAAKSRQADTENKSKAAAASDVAANYEKSDAKTKSSSCSTSLSMNIDRPLPPAPTATGQFYSNWKELNVAQKCLYLKSIELSQLCKILGAGFDSDTLTDILHVIRHEYASNSADDMNLIAQTLLQTSRNNQIKILAMLMSAKERTDLLEIVNALKKANYNENLLKEISSNFDLS